MQIYRISRPLELAWLSLQSLDSTWWNIMRACGDGLAYWLTMVTSSNGNIFCVTGPLCGEEFTGHWWIPLTIASDAELWCFFDLRMNKRLSKLSWGWWFETPPRSLWRHCNVVKDIWTFDYIWHHLFVWKRRFFFFVKDKNVFMWLSQ